MAAGTGTKTLQGVAAGAIVVALGVGIWALRPDEAELGEAVGTAAEPAASGLAVIETPEEVTENTPTFDIVRVEPDGRTLVAGRAAAGAKVDLQVDGAVVNQATADAVGRFVTFLDLAPSADVRALALVATGEDGQPSASMDTVLLGPTTANNGEPSFENETVADPGAVVLAGEDGLKLIQPDLPPEAPPEVMSAVALDAITYDAQGTVELTGRAAGSGVVRIYVDNRPIGDARIGDRGGWQVTLPEVETGTYTLRVDELDDTGAVTSRIETPFQREAPEALESILGDAQVNVQTIQPGNTLWAIADERYGRGVEYIRIFEANRDRIRNPDLIYPGQVFAIPE